MSQLSISSSPPPAGPELWIRRLKAREELVAVVLSDSVWGCHYHWSGKTSVPHTLPRSECVGCNHQYPLKWHGYLHIADQATRRQQFMELTPYALHLVETKTGLMSGFRGCRIRFKRGNGEQARLTVEYLGQVPEGVNLAEGRTPERELRILWGMPPAVGDAPVAAPDVDAARAA